MNNVKIDCKYNLGAGVPTRCDKTGYPQKSREIEREGF